MKRTSVMFPADLKARAVRAARERGISFGSLLRRSLEDALHAPDNAYDDPWCSPTARYLTVPCPRI